MTAFIKCDGCGVEAEAPRGTIRLRSEGWLVMRDDEGACLRHRCPSCNPYAGLTPLQVSLRREAERRRSRQASMKARRAKLAAQRDLDPQKSLLG